MYHDRGGCKGVWLYQNRNNISLKVFITPWPRDIVITCVYVCLSIILDHGQRYIAQPQFTYLIIDTNVLISCKK